MAKKMTEQNPVDEAFLQQLMAGSPGENEANSKVHKKKEQNDVSSASGQKKLSDPDQALDTFISRFLASNKCEARQGVYIDRELHQKITAIVGITGKRQFTVGNYIDNVLAAHFEEFGEEIKIYCQKNYNKIF